MMTYVFKPKEDAILKRVANREYRSIRELQISLGWSHKAVFDAVAKFQSLGLMLITQSGCKNKIVTATEELKRVYSEKDYSIEKKRGRSGIYVDLDSRLSMKLKMVAISKGKKYRHLVEEYIRRGLERDKVLLDES